MDSGSYYVNVGSSNIQLLWGVLIIGKAMPVYGQQIYGKSLYLSLNFTMNLKLLQKVKSI